MVGGLVLLSRIAEKLDGPGPKDTLYVAPTPPVFDYDFKPLASDIAGIRRIVETPAPEPVVPEPKVVKQDPPTVYKIQGDDKSVVRLSEGVGEVVGILKKHTKLLQVLMDDAALRTDIKVDRHKIEWGETVKQVPRHGER